MQLINKLCILKFAVIIFISNLSATDVYYQGGGEVTIKNDREKLFRESLYKKIGNLSSICNITQHKDCYSVIIEMHNNKLIKKLQSAYEDVARSRLAICFTALLLVCSLMHEPENTKERILKPIFSSCFLFYSLCFYNMSETFKAKSKKIITKIKRNETILKELNSI